MKRLAMICAVLAVVVTACGGDSAAGTTAASSTTATTEVPTTTAAAPTTIAPPASTVAPEATITIQGSAFGSPITIEPGDTVKVTNRDSSTHTWTSVNGLFDSGDLGQGQSFSFTFTEPGVFRFMCTIHTSMTGSVTVAEPAAAFTPETFTVAGTVTAVDGSLATVNSFTLRLQDGTDLTVAPAEGLLFDGTAPISHVRDHLVSGEPIAVTYLTVESGLPVAIEVGDA